MLQAKLLGLNTLIEEEVILDINGIRLVGFANICRFEIKPDKIYTIEIHLTFLDGSELIKRDEEVYGLKRINSSYGYMLYGKVNDESINVGNGIIIKDDVFKENLYLNGEFVEIKVDRLTIEFIKELKETDFKRSSGN